MATGVVRGARATYRPEDIAVLKSVWLAAGQPCGQRLAGEMLGLWLVSWQKHHGALSPAQRKRLEQISAAQIDREMAPYRSGGRKRRLASSALAAMQREVAVRCEPWAETAPGALEIDTIVLHLSLGWAGLAWVQFIALLGDEIAVLRQSCSPPLKIGLWKFDIEIFLLR
ncbi:MAG: hypothetical protein ACOYMN_23405 [Roseimicrobium sp.]